MKFRIVVALKYDLNQKDMMKRVDGRQNFTTKLDQMSTIKIDVYFSKQGLHFIQIIS